jgi:hypothetical protein
VQNFHLIAKLTFIFHPFMYTPKQHTDKFKAYIFKRGILPFPPQIFAFHRCPTHLLCGDRPALWIQPDKITRRTGNVVGSDRTKRTPVKASNALPWFRRAVDGILLRMAGFDLRLVHAAFVLYIKALPQIFLQVSRFYSVTTLPPISRLLPPNAV